jgi:hypothetical protein
VSIVNIRSWYDSHQLVHYTRDAATVSSILENGFLLVPNGRGLIQKLLNTTEFSAREPQQFGMVSFTELQTAEASRHREQFGEFGIAVTWEWALRHNAQRVIYLGDGSVMSAFAWLFQFARQELLRKSPEPVVEFTMSNRAVAGMYSQLYGHLLTLYEFMEPERNSSQVEWRIVNSLPAYMDLTDRTALIRKLIEQARAWKLGTVSISPKDVTMLIAPSKQIKGLRSTIPAEFRHIPIAPLTRNSHLSRIISLVGHLHELRLKQIAGLGAVKPAQSFARENIPEVAAISGIAVTPDDVLERARVSVSYHSQDREFNVLNMPFIEAARLHGYLHAAMSDTKLGPLVQLASKVLRKSRGE